MTILEAINTVDGLKYNTYTTTEKVAWLSRLDSLVKRMIIDTHEGWEDVSFGGYNDKTPQDTELLVPAPFDEIYLRWLEAQIDYANGEYDKYNNSILMYKAAYDGYANYYNRNNMPLGVKNNQFSFGRRGNGASQPSKNIVDVTIEEV